MKGDFTRFTHDPEKHYTDVRKQQGRVDLDADWNEYVDIQNHLRRTNAIDVIGHCGVPEGSEGFHIDEAAAGGTLTISPGRLYVDGILCENEHEHPIPITEQPYLPGYELPTEREFYVVYVDVWKRHITAVEDPDLREVALGGPETTTRVQTVWQVKLDPVDSERCPLPGWLPEEAASTGRLRARAQPEETRSDPCALPAGAGYRGLENRLYRIEIHDDGRGETSPGPTFKWSRDNGSVVFPVEVIAGNRVTLKRLGRDEVLTLHVGDWVEVLGDETELHGRPGTLAQIDEIDEAERTVSLNTSVSEHSGESHVKMRRWDHHATETVALRDGAIPIPTTPDTFIPLEDGVQIQFEVEEGRTYRTGDYWVAPARTATGSVLWPKEGEDAVALGRQGILHHYCVLAVVGLANTWQVPRDCRLRFPPLATPGVVVEEVLFENTNVSLRNDTQVALDDFDDGIRIQCSEPVDANAISRATCFVTVEIPSIIDQTTLVGYQILVLAGTPGFDDLFITWTPVAGAIDWLREMFDNTEGMEPVLAHLTLKGNFIWSAENPTRYLDGEAFGTWSEEGRTALDLPSGNRRRGGDFEMWFWLTPDNPPDSPNIEVDSTGLRLDIIPPDPGSVADPPRGPSMLFSEPGTIRVSNTGRAVLEVRGIHVAPENRRNFEFLGPVDFNLRPGEFLDISVQFTTSVGSSGSPIRGMLIIPSNDPDSPEEVELEGHIRSPFSPTS